MQEFATSTISTISQTSSFWQEIPAAAYVLLGVVISGCFTIGQSLMNSKSDKEIKNLENRNNKELKELENAHARQLKELEAKSNEKIQSQNEEAQKALRLLDDKIKTFSDFHNCYSEMLVSGTSEERMRRIECLRKSSYKVRLLAISLKKELDDLDVDLTNYANFYFEIVHGKKTYKSEDRDREEDKYLSDIRPQMLNIFEKLASEM